MQARRWCLRPASNHAVLFSVFLLASPRINGATPDRFELLLKGGHVIDPASGTNEPRDVAITHGRVARVARGIPVAQADKVIDVAGLFIVPGLVDIHVHVYAGTGHPDVIAGDQSVYPDGHTFRSGVTTVADAGTSGWRTFRDFKSRVIDRAQTRVLAWLNIVGHGMIERAAEQVHADMDPRAAATLAKQYPEVIVGFKTAHYDGPEWIAVDRVVQAGRLADLPVMVDFGTFRKERPFEQLVLEKLRPGDLYTHFFHGAVPLLDERGRVRPYLAEARRRGVRFDLGHGRDSFRWFQAIPTIRQGFLPDSISTDLWTGNMNAGMKDMATTLSKFLALGLSLDKVIELSTHAPAMLIKRPELGTLAVGREADVAVFRLAQGEFGFLDARNIRFPGKQKLRCELTLRAGEVVWDLNGRAGVHWRGPDSASLRGRRD